MAPVRILPEILTNKIAAGEVVERPSSVLKELVENSLDAKSTRIVVEVKKGGRSLIQVADNGDGMDKDDALLCLERYATSKIYTDDDLFSISTLGFRGEALPSIGSVSRLTLITRKKDNPAGTKVVMQGGKIVNVSEIGAPPGTMITVADLFYNVPARRKFLKTVATEMGHIADTMSAMALGWPETAFELIHNDRKLFSWPAAQDPQDRIADVLGKDVAPGLIRFSQKEPEVSIEGCLAMPEFSRTTKRGLYIFVNGRLVTDKLVTHALMEGYKGRLMKGKYPVAVVFLRVPPDQVDVNVHPAKAEVRFVNGAMVHQALSSTVKESLDALDQTPWKSAPKPPVRTEANEDLLRQPPSQESFSSFVKEEPSWIKAAAATPPQAPMYRPEPRFDAPREPRRPSSPSSHSAALSPQPREDSAFSRPEPPVPDPGTVQPEPYKAPQSQAAAAPQDGVSDLKALGQFANAYVICRSSKGLLIVDQHAAHERILFEQFKKHMEVGGIEIQNLLIPETFELSHIEAEILERILPDLQKTGIDVDRFSGRTFVVKAAPAMLANSDIGKIVKEMVEKVAEAGGNAHFFDALDECLIVMACHGSVRAHQSLSIQEMDALLKQLEACERPSQCPHGRPTWLLWTEYDLERAFKRK
ncbi:DNA mismatch repair protein MutL [Desulfatibacillum aliphaticivorans]|uniref:DNA mismatch repair protein MutL n=1 Tax=Desulfatibacillum aliphaticivorans TaxID=218208 RepID=B8FCK7_DESAL|nr:DNA mismatch repair endonuclease MutL [Desulfatibacillum aliphaticivorans]ACL06170.1 DNA mismatch repair protein MutL [Desulfatibacillum aliphaticivorans]